MNKHVGGLRWYDTAPHISQSFDRFHQIPPEYRSHFVYLLNTVIQKMQAEAKKASEIKSLGLDRTRGLFKAREKKRFGDKDQILFKTFLDLFTLPDSERQFLANRISLSVSCLDLYQETCKRQGKQEVVNDLMQIINAAIIKGLSAAQLAFHKSNLLDAKASQDFIELSMLFNEALSDVQKPKKPLPQELVAQNDTLRPIKMPPRDPEEQKP